MNTIKTGMIFSVQENGSFHVINDGEKVGFIRKNVDKKGWHIDSGDIRFGVFPSSSDARKHATGNPEIF